MNFSLHSRILLASLCLSAGLASPLQAQDTTVEERLEKLEAENAELRAQMGSFSLQMEAIEFRDIIPPVGDSYFGMGPAASKIYGKESGLSIGGYGELVYKDTAGTTTSTSDFVRNILYVGYKFDERWVFNSEIEVEHADEIFLEFAYLEYLADEAFNVRAGMLLLPMGHVNEMHEPTTFRGPARPETESRILPSTWRENGVGLLGDVRQMSYKAYVVTGLNAAGFTESGLRGGRQKGSQSKSEDLAAVARLDWNSTHGLNVGVSGYHGDSGQGGAGLADATTTIFDAHLQYQWRGLRVRGLFAQAKVEDTHLVSLTNAKVVGKQMRGWYAEAGYDLASELCPDSGHAVIPFVRYEELNTHDVVADGLVADPLQDETITTLGIDWLPIANIVFKGAYLDNDKGKDSLQLSLGYVF